MPAERPCRREARRVGAPGLDVQRARRRRPPPVRRAGRRRARLRRSGPRRLLLVQGPRRARPVRGALRPRRRAAGAAAEAAETRRAGRAPGRRRSRDRGELGLAGDGHLQGPGDRAREAAARPRRTGSRDDRRRRAPGRPELGGSAGGRPRTAPPALGVVDRNEVQSDKRTEEILALGDLETKLRAFGWHVETADGHDHVALRAAFARFRAGGDTPKALVARTVKGKGVSFMEHPVALADGGGPIAGMPARRATSRSRARSSSSRPVSPRSARPSASSRPRSRPPSRRRASAASRPSRNRAPARAGRL